MSSDPHIARPSRLPPLGAPKRAMKSACRSIERNTNWESGGGASGGRGPAAQRGGIGGTLRGGDGECAAGSGSAIWPVGGRRTGARLAAAGGKAPPFCTAASIWNILTFPRVRPDETPSMEVHMTNTLARRLGLAFLMLALSFAANATYHLFRITQVYSNADGTVQYILLTATSGGQQYITGKNIKSSQGSVTHTFTFTKDLPADTAMTDSGGSDGYGGYYGGSTSYRTVLIATQGFASLGLVTPDYIVPDGFLFTGSGTINYADGSDLINYSSLPTDGVTAMNRGGATATNTAQNFNGITVSIANSDFASYEGLWLGTAANEAGWGLNLTHQGSTLFGTWFTYDTDGSGMWLVMSGGTRTAVGTYSGALYRTTGPAFSAANFGSLTPSNYTQVGTLTLTFSNTNTGTMSYTVHRVTQTKPIARYVYVASPPTCVLGQAAGSSPNY